MRPRNIFLGGAYFQGNDVAQDYGKAAEPFRQAAEQGNAQAQNDLGVMFENGFGVQRDLTEAFNWFTRSAEQGDASGQSNFGSHVCRGLRSGYRPGKSLSVAEAQRSSRRIRSENSPSRDGTDNDPSRARRRPTASRGIPGKSPEDSGTKLVADGWGWGQELKNSRTQEATSNKQALARLIVLVLDL